MTATADQAVTPAATFTSVADLLALPVHTEVADCEGTVWKKIHGSGWHFRCAGGLSRTGQSSQWLAVFEPFTLVSTPSPEPEARTCPDCKGSGTYWWTKCRNCVGRHGCAMCEYMGHNGSFACPTCKGAKRVPLVPAAA